MHEMFDVQIMLKNYLIILKKKLSSSYRIIILQKREITLLYTEKNVRLKITMFYCNRGTNMNYYVF